MLSRFSIVGLIVLAFLSGYWLRGVVWWPSTPSNAINYIAQSRISTLADVERERRVALLSIFGGSLPTDLPSEVRPMNAVYGAASALELVSGQSYFLVPKNPNGKLFIWHAGHWQDVLIHDAQLLGALLDLGFHVIAMNMPSIPHEEAQGLDPFLRPVAVSLNYAETRGFRTAVMAGLSGGGWTTTVYSALDRRITASIPIAGSLPLGIPDATRDYEQFLPGLYLDYLDLYLMASSDGHRQTQILNSHDVCCFKGVYSDLYREFAVEASRSLGGRFEVIVANRSEHSVPMREFLGTIQSLAESNSSLSHQ